MFSPTTATAASSFSSFMGAMAPDDISLSNALLSTSQARSASLRLTPMDIPVSDADWLTRNALMLSLARVVKILLSTPTIPTMEVPERVMRLMSSMDEMPLIALLLGRHSRLMVVPGAAGLKVFLMRIGISFAQTGYRVGG